MSKPNIERIHTLLDLAFSVSDAINSQGLSKAFLMRMLYLVDLDWAVENGRTYTGASWVFYPIAPRGPWSDEVEKIVDAYLTNNARPVELPQTTAASETSTPAT
jgi:hypothetical protein